MLDNILRESEENQKEAEFFLTNYLEPSFPEIEQEVKTRKVSFFILHSFKSNKIDSYRHHRPQQRERTARAQLIRPPQPNHPSTLAKANVRRRQVEKHLFLDDPHRRQTFKRIQRYSRAYLATAL